MRNKFISALYLCVVFALYAVAICLLGQESFSTVPAIEGVDHIYHNEELIPRENITSFIVSDDNIYIFYDKTGLINVYSLTGSFKYGIQIPTIVSGEGNIAVLEGKLFVSSRKSSIYIFDNGQFEERIDLSADSDRYLAARSIFSQGQNFNNDSAYKKSELSNDIVSKDNSVVLIDFPEKSTLAETLLIIATFLIGIFRQFLRFLETFH